MNDRLSLPPGDDSLARMTKQYSLANDRHEAALAASAVVVPTDEQRLAVCRELLADWYSSGATHLDQTMANYERKARDRIAARKPAVTP